jgi:ABC-type lipoprotein export system ATPase subunit
MSFSIKRIEVRGLHGRSDIALDLHPDVNILYGRNGSGKTTLLHIIANVLSGSLDRFAYIQFDDVRIISGDSQEILLESTERGGPRENWPITITVDGSAVAKIHPHLVREYEAASSPAITAVSTFRLPPPTIASPESFSHHDLITKAALQLPVEGAAYFPAFRTMIEAWRSAEGSSTDTSAYFSTSPSVYPYREGEESRLTRLARQLFGRFVPEIDYPSVIEIERNLSTQVKSIEFDITTTSEELLSNAFVEAFAALSQGGPRTLDDPHHEPAESTDSILESIEQLVKDLNESQIADFSETRQAQVPQQLREILPRLASTGQSETGMRILSVYRNFLKEQVAVQRSALYPIEYYVDSVNAFLEGKRVVISRIEAERHDPKVQIEFDDGSREGLKALSSGERQIVSMLYAALSSSIQESSVVLIDEPELSLHIDWQRLLIRSMAEQLGGRQLIVCTHSPEIGADYEDRYQEVRSTPSRRVPL